jgi:cystathionine beta-lyase/cystathionine gamma-synthase|eukprot:COSAG01_NODE_888_length_12915_cov_10.708723_9_plen_234_part_00
MLWRYRERVVGRHLRRRRAHLFAHQRSFCQLYHGPAAPPSGEDLPVVATMPVGDVQPAWDVATLAIHADGHAIAQAAAACGGGSGDGAAPAAGGLWSHDRDIAPPIGVTTTFECQEGAYVYSRMANPTRDRCEAVLAALEASPGEATPDAILYASGLAAAHAILVAQLPSIQRIAISGGYHGTHLILDILQGIRPDVQIIELPSVEEAAAGALSAGDLVWLESPRNPACEVYE